MSSISIILTMSPPVSCATLGLTSMRLFLSTDYMGCYHRLVSHDFESSFARPTDRVSHTSRPQIVIHSVLASRILFNLREESEEHLQIPTTHVVYSEILFHGNQHLTSKLEV